MSAGIFVLPSFLGSIQYDAITGDFTNVSGAVESTCDATGHQVAYWKFRVPPSIGRMSSVTLQLNEFRPQVVEERAPVVHELWWYKGEMAVTAADYEGGSRPTSMTLRRRSPSTSRTSCAPTSEGLSAFA